MAKTKNNAVETVERLVAPVVQQMGLRLWDVRFEKEGPDWYLRVLADAPGRYMDTDICAELSHAIDPLLDEADPIEQSYFLEVGSPGLGRKLTRPEHYEWCRGEKVAVHLIRPDESGCRDYSGTLLESAPDEVALETPAGPRRFALSTLSYAKLCDDEELFD